MNEHNAVSWKRIRLVIACLVFSSGTQNVSAGSLLSVIDGFLTGHYPAATAYLSLYDPDGAYIDGQSMDATGLLSSGYINTGTEIVFNGSLVFPDPYPLYAGGSGGFLATVHGFSVDMYTATASSSTDLVTFEIDWLYDNQSISNLWDLNVGDDFDNGIAYYIYGSYPPQPLTHGYALFSLEFATGIAPVPLPAGIWLFGAGLLFLAGVNRKRAHS